MSKIVTYKLFFRDKSVIDQVKEILYKTEYDFIPALSEKINIEELAVKYIEKAYLLISYVNEKPAGMVAFYINSAPENSYLSLICVVEDFRGLGIGKELEIRCINECKRKLSKGITVNMRKSNTKLYNSRLKLGWKVEKEYMNQFGNELIVDMYLNFDA